jgi:arylsulfatase A-like enzyme
MTPDGMEVDTYGDFDQYDWLPNEKGFARMVQRLDITVGRVLAKLKELGIAENTLVLFSSDNGPHNEGGHSVTTFHSAGGFKGYKRSLNEGGIRVPFVAWWPGTIEGGQTSEHLGYFPDVINTVCEVTGANKVPYSDGIPLTRLLRGETEQQKKHPYLYFEYQNQRAVRLGHWKYFDDGKGIEGLFNLNEDKHEDHDVKEEHGELFRQLKGYIAVEHKDYDPFPLPDSRK